MAKRPSPTRDVLGGETKIAALVGKDPFLVADATRRLREALAGAHGEVETIRFDGLSARLADVLDECRTFGLMRQHKLVIVDNAEQLIKDENRALMERYAASPPEGATLLLRCERWYKGKLDALIERVGCVLSLAEPSDADAIVWAIGRCPEEYGCAIQRDGAQLLVDRLGPDLGRIDMELAKLSLMVEKGGPITTKEVADGVGVTREEEVWEIKRTLLTGDAAQILGHLRLILDNSRKDSAVAMSWAFMDLARQLAVAARGLRAGVNPGVLMKDLKLWGANGEAVLGAAHRVDPKRAAALMHEAVEADVRSKTGLGEPERTLERLALRFASLGA